MIENEKWCENIIIADADYINKVAFELTVNFERMIGRRIPKADIARWIDCVALDGGLREGSHETLVVLVHDKSTATLENFSPSSLAKELGGKAFKDNLGEFSIITVSVEDIVSKSQILHAVVGAACVQSGVKRIMIVPDGEDGETYAYLRDALSYVDDDSKRITMFSMQPMQGGNFRQEILGYSLLSALGISAEEIDASNN